MQVMTTPRLVFSFCITVLVAFSSALASDQIVINDVSGQTRAMSDGIEGSGSIEFSVIDAAGNPADGFEISLMGQNGEILTATTINGTAVFEGVTPGIYTVATKEAALTFTNVYISATSAAAAAGGAGAAGLGTLAGVGTGAAVIGGTALAVGGIAYGIDNNSKKNDPISVFD